MAAVCNNVREKYIFAQEEKPSINITTAFLGFLAIIVFLFFVFSVQSEGTQKFCLSQGYNYVAYISANKVCINENLAYIEIKCSGIVNFGCEALSEEKQFNLKEDFSEYKIGED